MTTDTKSRTQPLSNGTHQENTVNDQESTQTPDPSLYERKVYFVGGVSNRSSREALRAIGKGAVVLTFPPGRPKDRETVPAIAECIGPDQWFVSEAGVGDWVSTSEEVMGSSPSLFVSNDATVGGLVLQYKELHAEKFVTSDLYARSSFVYGRTPSGKLIAYRRKPRENGNPRWWEPLTTNSPAMPDALADSVLRGWDVIANHLGRKSKR